MISGPRMKADNSGPYTTVYEHDARSFKTATAGAEGYRTEFDYDAAENVTQMRQYLRGGSLDRKTRYGYNGVSKLVSLIDPLDRETNTSTTRPAGCGASRTTGRWRARPTTCSGG